MVKCISYYWFITNSSKSNVIIITLPCCVFLRRVNTVSQNSVFTILLKYGSLNSLNSNNSSLFHRRCWMGFSMTSLTTCASAQRWLWTQRWKSTSGCPPTFCPRPPSLTTCLTSEICPSAYKVSVLKEFNILLFSLFHINLYI